ncbi:Wadjet anti-phage system protein JetD domain-containing protein [Methylobacter sp.]|uniref:Wadjet anti-phage system protein JetD domain-containing protein n=1 Tax=Methylobacter sp. TaxID=2051955 RepID=UPI0024877759|nr:Wadjet anti-phage system protein JetD domain-containing protein [Methylobacter sp.]MDI1277038.1 DUF2220 family protein [Methylobacter sp.]MDI1357656.1 DUF2220 family protein [Methylobacter sp.]
MPKYEDRIYQWFLKRSGKNESGKVRASGVMGKLCAEIANDPIAIRRALLNLQSQGHLVFSADPRGEPISPFITAIRPVTDTPVHANRWQTVLEDSGLPENSMAALYPLYNAMEDFNTEHMEILLAGLRKLRDEQHLLTGQPSYVVSATYLMGSSKLLFALDAKSLRLFGIDIDKFTARTPYMMVGGGGKAPQSVILVENPIAFEVAVQSIASIRHTFVCTFGFGLSNAQSEYGNQLAGAVEAGRAILLRRTEGPYTSFEQLLQHPEIHFWGDLDTAGLQIFERIAARIPHLKLSALYKPMIKAATNPMCCHPYVMAVGKAGQKPFKPTREDTETLLKYCGHWAVDQEIVCDDDIKILSGVALEFK